MLFNCSFLNTMLTFCELFKWTPLKNIFYLGTSPEREFNHISFSKNPPNSTILTNHLPMFSVCSRKPYLKTLHPLPYPIPQRGIFALPRSPSPSYALRNPPSSPPAHRNTRRPPHTRHRI
jgi:hypothetical protein